MKAKAIIAAAGEGTRLYPMTKAVPKPLLPVAGKPMIYYPLSQLIEAGFTDILIIAAEDKLGQFTALLGDGADWGISISYALQHYPAGIAQCLVIGESFIGSDPITLMLGDNLFWGPELDRLVAESASTRSGAAVFAYQVSDPENFGVIAFDPDGRATSLEEKPRNPQSNYCVPGLYCYDNHVVEIAKTLTKSTRDEFEITDVNRAYLAQNRLSVTLLDSRYTWHDTGTHHSIQQAEQAVRASEQLTGTLIGSPELAAYRKGYIDSVHLQRLGEAMKKTPYGQRLMAIARK